MEQQAMAVREENWLRAIQAAAQSGKTQEAWCREHDIAPSTFYRWKQTLRNRLLSTQQAEAPASCFSELALPEKYCRTQSLPSPDKILVHTRKFTIELPADCSEEQLSRVIRAVGHAG
ncbi:IS66 family insertion sequence element accessory protein TnpA [Ruthenibacterium lactatiformans]|uniref:IS66 family insertion sequence element accessory protein TnpA n=1 Tax=Ruthenibacterium lactatiformans TaxID=1550024 RepID=UPI0039F44D42